MRLPGPIISVITAVCNEAATIRDCLESIRRQDYPYLEHIIVDGGSKDGTLAVVEQYAMPSARVISEPDTGVYDAMNKGIRIASGSIIGTLNADDFYVHDGVLSAVADVLQDPAVDSCYGDLTYVNRTDTTRVVRHWRAGTYDKKAFYRGWMPPHPTFFVKRHVYETYGGFNLGLGSAADYELMLRFLLKHGISCRYVPQPLVFMRTGGVSNASLYNRLKAHQMDRKAWKVNGLKPKPWTMLIKPLSKIGQYFFRPLPSPQLEVVRDITLPQSKPAPIDSQPKM